MYSQNHYYFVVIALGQRDEAGVEQAVVYTLDTTLKTTLATYMTDEERSFLNSKAGKLWFPNYKKGGYGPISLMVFHQLVSYVFPSGRRRNILFKFPIVPWQHNSYDCGFYTSYWGIMFKMYYRQFMGVI